MAVVKNNVGFRDNNPITRDNSDIDIRTGRAVYVDSEKYENNSEYKARVDQYILEGFHVILDGESGESGGSGGSDSGCDCDPGYECNTILYESGVYTATVVESEDE